MRQQWWYYYFMQIVGAGVVAVVAFMALLMFSESAPQEEAVQIVGTAGVSTMHREPLHFSRPAPVESAPAPVSTAPVVPKAAAPQIVVPVQPPPVFVPPPVAVPEQDPAVSACLGKFVSDDCSFTAQGATKSGTCITLPFSPMLCVAH